MCASLEERADESAGDDGLGDLLVEEAEPASEVDAAVGDDGDDHAPIRATAAADLDGCGDILGGCKLLCHTLA